MKILIIQDFLRSGGTERQSLLLANAFSAAGHDTTLLTFRPGGALARTVAGGVSRRILQPFDFGLDWFAPGLIADAQRIAPDVILCMGRMANCYAGRLQLSCPAAAVVATMRTGKPLPALFRRSLHRVRHIVANSYAARLTLQQEHGVAADNVTVIHNSLVFPAATLSRNDALRREHGANARTQVLLCVAMFRPEKNQRELVEIAAGLPSETDWQLWLAGDGVTKPACEALVAQKNLGARVKFVGFHRDPSPLYRAADMAVHASWSEALSNFLIEAQAHGLPAVAYEAQGIDECFLPGRTGWAIPRDDRTAFRSALSRLFAMPEAERGALSCTAREHARTAFDPGENVHAYLGLFRRLTGL